jgi:hypothetical protein
MANVTGLFGSASLPTDFGKKSFAAMLTKFKPGGGNAQLFAMTSMLGDEPGVINTEHGYWSKAMVFPSVTLTAAVADGVATTFTVADSSQILPNMILRSAATGEHVLVLTVPNGTSITVTRAFGTTAGAAIGNTTKLFQVGTAFEEGSTRPQALTITPTLIKNYTQIFRNSWAVTRTNSVIAKVAGSDSLSESRQDAVDMHATNIETALIFGQKYSGTKNGQPIRQMEGLISMTSTLAYYPPSYAAANVTTLGATTTYDQLLAAIDPCFNQVSYGAGGGDGSRILLGGAQTVNVLHAIGRKVGAYQLMAESNSYGLQFSTIRLPRGTLRIVEHPLFNALPGCSNMALVLDPSTFNVGYLGGAKTLVQQYDAGGNEVDHVPDSGTDASGGTFTTELTCICKNPPANAVLYNFTAAA